LFSTGIDGLTEPPWSATYPGERYLKTGLPQLPGKIAWVLGASMFVRRECFAAVKGFDEEFFLYSEETDLCLRLRKAGFRIGYVPEVLVTHVGGASERGRPAYDVWKRKIDGLYLFYEKHYSNSDKMRLINRDLRRARLQLFLASLNFPFQGNLARKAKYRAILDSGLEWIDPGQD
jgi:GT2 family glycosyltransferase